MKLGTPYSIHWQSKYQNMNHQLLCKKKNNYYLLLTIPSDLDILICGFQTRCQYERRGDPVNLTVLLLSAGTFAGASIRKTESATRPGRFTEMDEKRFEISAQNTVITSKLGIQIN